MTFPLAAELHVFEVFREVDLMAAVEKLCHQESDNLQYL
jgi:hypothetical protein